MRMIINSYNYAFQIIFWRIANLLRGPVAMLSINETLLHERG
jgi:hypothetical protein